MVKKILVFIVLFFSHSFCGGYQLSEKEKLVLQMEKETIQLIEKKYDIYAVGFGGSLMQGIEHLGLSFQIDRPLSKEEARCIVVDCAQIYLNKINSNERFTHLIKKQFSINEVAIMLFILDSQKRDLYDPQICLAQISNGVIVFRTNSKENKYKYKANYEETYEEALKLIQSSVCK